MTLRDHLHVLGACREALVWIGDRDLPTAWAECERGDWMLWLAGRACGEAGSQKHRAVVLAACACARTALDRVPADEDRPRLAIEAAEAWARGDGSVSVGGVRRAATAARAAADAAAYAAYAAAYAAAAAAYAAADYAAYAADADAARTTKLRECADIVRRMVPMPVLGGAS